MDQNNIDSLREALRHSPDNIPLRLLLAESLLNLYQLDEAEEEYTTILTKDRDHLQAKTGLAKVFFQKGNFSACNVIFEEVVGPDYRDLEGLTLFARALLEEGEQERATEMYQRVLAINPHFKDEKLDTELRLPEIEQQLEDEMYSGSAESPFLQKPGIDFKAVGGMEAVKKEIELKIIKPLQHPELYKAYGKKIGGGILLYGPPGCGKTHIARATAGQVNARFISVGLSDILDMWVGGSERNLSQVFEIARRNTPCVLFIDEIDALGASRSDMKRSSGRHLINQFLQELDGVDNDNEGVLVLAATNTPWNLDPAFRRPGRFDRIIFVPPPDEHAREVILKLKLEGKPVENIDYASLARKAKHFSGADIDALIDIAIEAKLEASFADGIPKPLNTKDLQKAMKKHKASTQEWFMSAKNFALFANDAGLYDEVLEYINKKK